MTDTTHLGLPFIDGSQAQKHVTHNEALRILDAAIQIGVLETTLAMPPGTPAAGARYLVPAGASGAWSGQADAIACWEDGAWRFLVPSMGWCIWSAADEMQLVFNGSEWRNMPGGATTLSALTELGINTTPDGDNLFSVRSNAALFNAIAAADGGSGDMRIQISKEGGGNTASVVFSDAFSGRAEFGLVGSDAFKLKVSGDGTTFTEAFAIDQASGNLTLPRGVTLSGVLSPATIAADQNDYNPAGLSACSVLQLSADAPRTVSGFAGGAEGRMLIVLNVGSQTVTLRDDSASSAAANRFAFGADIVFGPKQAVMLRYDGTAARWFAIARSGGAGGGGGSGSVTGVTAGAGLSGGTITSSGTISLADDIRRNIALDRIYQAKLLASPRRAVNAWADGFKSSSGINSGSSSNYAIDLSTGKVAPTATPTTAYVTGDRTASITVTTTFTIESGVISNLVNGSFANNTSNSWVWNVGQTTGYVQFDFGSAIFVTEAKWYQSGTSSQGTFKFQGSNDGSSFSDIGSSFTLGGTATQTITALNGNKTAYRYLRLTAAGASTSNAAFLQEIEFKSGATATADSMTVVTASQTTDANVGNARVLLEFDNTATPALNIDLTAEVTCNGGTNWTSATLSAVTAYSQSGRFVAETADVSCTAGALFAARIKTLNNKNVPIYGVSVAVR